MNAHTQTDFHSEIALRKFMADDAKRCLAARRLAGTSWVQGTMRPLSPDEKNSPNYRMRLTTLTDDVLKLAMRGCELRWQFREPLEALCSADSVDRALNRLCKVGLLTKSRIDNRSHRYAITEEGRARVKGSDPQ